MTNTYRFDVNRTHVSDTKWSVHAWTPLDQGQVRLNIGPCALTANNISYAVMGDRFGYWRFFPVTESGWGCLPVWGYADVVEEMDTGLSVGERIYGYFPMATDVVMTPSHVSAGRFVDASPHRRELPAVYNDYSRVANDPSHDASKEAYRALLVPLAATAFGLADWLAEEQFLGADVVGCISASSKTAIATAMLVQEWKGARSVIGFTSARHLESVEAIGVYDAVIPYDDVSALDAGERHVLIDFAGNAHFSARLHAYLGDNMLHNALVGASHPDAPRKAEGMNGERSHLFFMPAYAEKRMAETGGQFLKDMVAAGRRVADQSSEWLQLRRAATSTDIKTLYADVLTGAVPPTEGGIIDFDQIEQTS